MLRKHLRNMECSRDFGCRLGGSRGVTPGAEVDTTPFHNTERETEREREQETERERERETERERDWKKVALVSALFLFLFPFN